MRRVRHDDGGHNVTAETVGLSSAALREYNPSPDLRFFEGDAMITIDLPPEIEARVKDEATLCGLKAEEYVHRLIVKHLPSPKVESSLADLFAEWDVEDATDDPAEIRRRNEEAEEFKQAMNRNRLEMEGPGSRKLFP